MDCQLEDPLKLFRHLRMAEQLISDVLRHRVSDQPGQMYLRSEDDQLKLALRFLSAALCELTGDMEVTHGYSNEAEG